MKIIAKTGKENIAMVYIAEMDDGKLIEFGDTQKLLTNPLTEQGKKYIRRELI